MTVAEICIISYLIVGALASAVLWTALVASARHEDRSKNGKGERVE